MLRARDMGQVILEDGSLRLDIDPEVGAGVSFFGCETEPGRFLPLLRPAFHNATWFNDLSCYQLVPWSNRIAAARLDWRGRPHELRADWADGTAIHGLTKDKPWRIRQRSPVSVLLAFSSADHPGLPYPWAFEAEVAYRTDGGKLTTELSVTHVPGGACGDSMPAGLGFHPFWRRSLEVESEDVSVRLSGLRRYPWERMIPTGPPEEDAVTRHLARGWPLGSLALDDVFLGSCDGAEIVWPRSGVRVRYECSPELGHTVLYTADTSKTWGGFFCLEPVTMVNDGFNVESKGWDRTGVRALNVGESMRVSWAVRVDRT